MSSLVKPKVFVWATNKAEAVNRAHAKLAKQGVKVYKKDLDPKYIGVIDPGGYDYVGSAVDGYTEHVGASYYRYSVSYG